MTSPERAEYLRSLVDDIGIEAAVEETGMKRESIHRAIRVLNASKCDPVDDAPLDPTLRKLAERYSMDELRALLKDKERHHDASRTCRHDFSGEWVRFGIMSDVHEGSLYTDDSEVDAVIDEMNRRGCEGIAFPGDITEGMSGRDGHIYELTHIGYREQRKAAIARISRFKGKVWAISGNHDLWYASKADHGALIVEDICEALPDAEYLGEHEGSIYFNGARVDLWHGEDGASYALSYRIQKIVENLEGGTKPNMIIAGHDHKAEYIPNLRNIQAIEAGCIQHQTPFMRRKKLAAFTGFWIVEMCVRDGQIIKVRPEWTTLYVPRAEAIA